MAYLNPAERQAIWNQKIEEHGATCPVCDEDETECPDWVRLIGFYNTAAWPAVDLEPGES